MDSINSFKGYGKVDEGEERAFQQKTRRRIIIIVTCCIVLATIVVGAVVGTLVHKKSKSSPSPVSTTDLSQSIKAVCSVTQYPNSCVLSLQSANKSDPEELFQYSLQIAMNEMGKISSLPEKLMSRIKNDGDDTRVKAALKDCQTLLEDAVDELNTSISSMQVGENLLTSMKVDNIKTWISSAITNQETCLDGLDEMKSGEFLTEMKTAMKNSSEYTSNSLAIVTKIMTVLEHLDIPIHRKLLSSFPKWVSAKDRRLLQVAGEDLKPDLTVAKDGTGNFKTISEAVASLGKKNKTRVVIYVKEGKYMENVVVDKAHWNIMMYGDGKTKTIVSSTKNFIDGTPTFSTATFITAGKGFIAKDMGFMNEAGPEKHQAVAFRSGSDQSVLFNCAFDAYQDTLYAHSNRQFYRDCDITGTIDFIFGNAAVVFQNCNIQPRQPMPNQFITVTAQGKKDPNQNTGISIQGGFITPLGKVTAKTYLGRPWKDFSTTVIIKVDISGLVDPLGWFPWVANVEPPTTIYYAEYQNTGLGSPVDRRVKWAGYKPAITADEAQKFTVDSFIQGGQWLAATKVTFEPSL